MNAAFSLRNFIWHHSKLQVLLVILLFGFAAMAMILQPQLSQTWKDSYSNYLDPMIAIGTLVVAALVWYNEQLENWKAQLPKRLHIQYLLPEKEAWRTHVTVVNAPLAGEDDIRNWGQSIGQTIFPQERGREDRPDPTWARILFTGFQIVQLPLARQSRRRDYGLLIYLSSPIKGAEDGGVYVFDSAGTKWTKQLELPQEFPLEAMAVAIPETI